MILQAQDLALLRRYEQARDLTVSLLKKWLVDYKFRSWTEHETNPSLKGTAVTAEQKAVRAEEIAKQLGDNKVWHSHGRMIGVDTLRDEIRLKIDDYSADTRLRPLVREYNDLLTEYISRGDYKFFLHSKNYF